jgi:hypothetical protein
LALVATIVFAFGPKVASAVSASLTASGATNMGFCGGDDWEPEIAAAAGHVYVGIAHFPGDPSCDPASGGPREIYVRSSADGGATFGPLVALPRLGYPNVVDVVVTVDEVTDAVYVSFLGYGSGFASDVLVAKSTDFGSTWTTTKINGPLCSECDHPWLVAHDDNVYVMYASGEDHFLSRSADGGATWTESLVLEDTHVAFPEGGVLDAAGNAWFAWGDCLGNCTGLTAAIYQVSKTTAGTSETTFARVAEGPAGPHCPPSVSCGFAYWGPQDDIAIDAAGNLYLVWQDNLPHKPGRPPIVQRLHGVRELALRGESRRQDRVRVRRRSVLCAVPEDRGREGREGQRDLDGRPLGPAARPQQRVERVVPDVDERRRVLERAERPCLAVRPEPVGVAPQRLRVPLRGLPGDRPAGDPRADGVGRGSQLHRRPLEPGSRDLQVDAHVAVGQWVHPGQGLRVAEPAWMAIVM